MKIRKLNKKAQDEDVETEEKQQLKFIQLVIWAVLLVTVLLIVVFFVSATIREVLDARDSEARVIAQRLLYSKTSITYVDDELGRAYPYYIDINKLNPDLLFNTLEMETNQMMAGKITVSSRALNKSWEAIYNEVWYERWLPLAGQKGSGASTWITEKRLVSVFQGDKYLGPGKIEIGVLMPNG